MFIILILAILGLVFLVMVSFLKTPNSENYSSFLNQQLKPYLSKNPLTKTEVIFYHKLIEALPEYIVLAQVQLSSFLKVDEKQINSKDHLAWFNPISRQSIDYLICRKDLSIIAAIELDDKSHNNAKAIERDKKKNEHLNAAKVPLIRWHAETMPDKEIIKQTILKYTVSESNEATLENDWFDDDDEENFLRRAEISADHLSQKIIFGVVLIALIFCGVSYFTSVFTKSINNQTQNIQLQNQEHKAELDSIQKQNSVTELHSNENELKEELWNRDYKKNTECNPSESMVICGNRYIQIRRKFEQNWEFKHVNPN